MTKRIGILYFSPTNTTEKICNAIALGMGAENPRRLNMTFPAVRAKIMADPDAMTADIDCLIVGAPVYFGKLPLPVIACLQPIRGNDKTCCAVVVYGNRDYGIALYHLVEILAHNGFGVIAAGAFIGQHSYSDIVPVAIGRPDKPDLEKACRFGVHSIRASQYLIPEDIPRQFDFFSRSEKYTPLKPYFIAERCIQCGICADYCPAGIIAPDTGTYINRLAAEQCQGCMACVTHCSQYARIAKPNMVLKLVMKTILKKASRERQEPLTIVA
jgi:Pyruvate/2-oxoacid:ferredoxin oxidoreductase delta subunit